MSFYGARSFDIDKTHLKADTGELARRLLVDKAFDMSVFCEYIKKAHEKVKPSGVYIRVPIEISADGVCDVGFAKTKSLDLAKNLDGCKEAFVFAVTLGIETERYLGALSKISPSEHFICDGYYSALCESACDEAEKVIKQSEICKPRFSPGYGDLSLSLQKEVLACLEASNRVGITLTESCLMVPQKSVTAIMGIKQR